MSNSLFLTSFVKPPMIAKLKETAKHPEEVDSKFGIRQIDGTNDYWQVQRNPDILLNKDNDPWLTDFFALVDPAEKALCFYINVRSIITMMPFELRYSDKSWQQLEVDEQGSLRMKQTREERGKEEQSILWVWLRTVLSGLVDTVLESILNALVGEQTAMSQGSFLEVGKMVVWRGQKDVKVKRVEMPGHVGLYLDVSFN